MTTPDAPDPTPRSATLLESIDHTRSSLFDAIRTGVISYAAVWVVTFLIGGLALLAIEAEDNVPWSLYLTAPGQIVAMSSNGTFDQTTTVDFDEEFAEFEDEDYSEDFSEFEDEEFDEDFSEFDGEEIPFPEDEGGLTFPEEDECCTDEECCSDELNVEEFEEDMDGETFIGGDDEMGGFTSSSQMNVIPLTILGLMIGALWIASRRAERLRPTPSRKAVLAAAVVTGATFAVLTWAVAFAARVDVIGDFGHAGSLSILFYGSALGTVVGLLARRPIARRNSLNKVPPQLVSAVRGVVVYLAVFVVLLVPAVAIYAVANGEAEAILALPLAILNLAVYGITLGQFAGIDSPILGLRDDESGPNFFWLFTNSSEGVFFVLIPLSVVALAVAVAVLARRSAGRPRTSLDAFWLVATFAAAGALLTAIGEVGTSTSGFGEPYGSGGALFIFAFAPVPWFFLVMAGWGVVTELAIRTIGRPLAAVAPDKLLDRLAGS
ncbi:hypothetical protein J2X11_001412 [Aeromicrobium panaciterrae]|uniref:Uncharacterized protein n=1 Tax=Aeromicrobium panaciterrae TaxID=363861 RepID=A0ABU1UN26_9ACTN|nr:hypothetical protein [Aeromicrobium panaciterrae]MDR7086573.1 hypothetical protein [Aeromicrobium panaciterrae]